MISFTSFGQLIGGVGLFLLGMMLMTDGLKIAAGRTLKTLLERWTDSSVHGMLSGVLLTALVQSSSAVTVAAIGFVNAGMLTLERSVWVIFGSNIGTTMTGWLVALVGLKVDVGLFAYPAIGVGMFVKLTGMENKRGAIGQTLAGFGMIFVGIAVLKDAFEGVAQTIDLSGLYTDGLLGVVTFVGIGFLMTLLTQASAAAISIALTAAAGNLIGLEPAAALVIGANIGTTSTALLASIGATPNAKRVAASHVVFNLLTGLVAVIILPIMLRIVLIIENLMELSPDVATSLALFHTVFNVLGVMLIWPLTGRLVKWLQTHFVSLEEDLSRPRFLDKTALVVPSLGLESLMLELSRLQGIAIGIVAAALGPLPADRQDLRQRLHVVETLSLRIGEYARKLYQVALPPAVSDALTHPYRALQHFEEIARIGVELPQIRADRPALDPHTEHLMETYLNTVVAELKIMTSADPMPADWSPQSALERVRTAYNPIKAALLTAGSRGEVTLPQLENSIALLEHVQACAKRAIKAERRLRMIRAAAQGLDQPQSETSQTDDA
ncbi:MAG: Na/Pi symporter [Rhodospirillales bacterium]|nr:Na/Pi symporter [Rhodospirillales bacterium]